LCGTNFLVSNSHFLGNAKVMFHSGVTPDGKCRCKM
jgi:hypothetical protein